jgi:hypothetical protein
MDLATLRRLAEGGISSITPGALGSLTDWCWDHSENTGDARFASIARTLQPVVEMIEEREGSGGVNREALTDLDRVLTAQLSAVIDVEDPILACSLARGLRGDVAMLVARHR